MLMSWKHFNSQLDSLRPITEGESRGGSRKRTARMEKRKATRKVKIMPGAQEKALGRREMYSSPPGRPQCLQISQEEDGAVLQWPSGGVKTKDTPDTRPRSFPRGPLRMAGSGVMVSRAVGGSVPAVLTEGLRCGQCLQRSSCLYS